MPKTKKNRSKKAETTKPKEGKRKAKAERSFNPGDLQGPGRKGR